ncbi:50S ribosome-binding GTPase [Domibacillus sp. PGB-M46]|uniref:GTPase domain-containing protein n=1 Tax=Domibacillus sp. PGB-M46 TaxID=2910255 RepID=UPI001F59F595|nr:GTPase domain-containing protein [Domibacillus sp. PGB-M46]MCI2256427.1 50S ribosome-binding GTPase [Domibacillus sp. PGB-M46]
MVKNPFKRDKKNTGYDSSVYDTASYWRKSRLEENFLKLGALLEEAKSRKIVFIGQPGAGKSSLLLKLTDGKCEPRPNIGQGTDTTDWSSSLEPVWYHLYNGTYFIDTPGYDTKAHPLRSYREYFPFQNVDATVFVIKGKVHQSDEDMFRLIMDKSERTSTVVLVRGYAEDLSGDDRKGLEQEFNEKFKLKRYNIPFFFVSSRSGEGIMELQFFLHIK